MHWRDEVRAVLPVVTGDDRHDDDIREELAQHCADRYASLLAEGVEEAEAARRTRAELRAAARRRSGLAGSARPAPGTRLAAIALAARQFAQDVQYGVRSLVRLPATSLSSIVTLALAIGATTAMFTVLHAVLLQPLPFPNPDRLVRLWEVSPRGDDHNVVSSGNYFDWRGRARSFQAIGAYQDGLDLSFTGDGDPERIRGALLTPSALEALGVPPAAGRLFRPGDGEPNRPRVMLLGDGFWRTRFASDPGIIGRTITFDDMPYEVIGVMPPGFDFPSRQARVWVPLRFTDSDRTERRSHNENVLARLAPGVTVAQAAAEMRGLASAIAAEHPQDMTNWSVNVVGLHDDLVRNVRRLLIVLMAVVAVVLVIACANLATLQLARASRRGFEVAVRAAIGAGRWRIIRQLVTESLVLSAAGGLLGLALLAAGLPALIAAAPNLVPQLHRARIDPAVLGFAAMVTVASAVLTGLVPALHISRLDLRPLLHGARTHTDARGSRLRHALVAAQVGLTLVLVIAAGLLVRSFSQLQRVAPGFDPDRLLTVALDLPASRYPTLSASADFYTRLIERVRALPGVDAAAGTTSFAGTGAGMTFSFAIEGHPSSTPSGREDPVPLQAVTPGYFETMRIPLARGRAFDENDRADSPRVAVINEALARRYWPAVDALGKRVTFRQGESPWLEIVGVVGNTHDAGLASPVLPTIYLPLTQRQENWRWMTWQTLMIRARTDPARLIEPVRRAIWSLDPRLPLRDVAMLDAALAENDATRRFSLALLAGFAGLALLLGAVGIYGVLACAVGERRQEIGIRVALGAQPQSVVASVVRPAMISAGLGVAAGMVLAFAVVGSLRALLFEVQPADPLTFTAAVVVIVAVAVAAAWLPARRATRLDPTDVLRQS